VGCFVARKDGCRSITETGGSIPITRSKYEENKYKQISINCHQKLSIGRQRKRKKMMPRGPKDEKRPADMIGMAGADLFALVGTPKETVGRALAFLSPRNVSERVMYPWPIGEFDNAMDKVRTEATK